MAAYFAVIAFVLGELRGARNPAWAEGLWAALLATVVVGLANAGWPDRVIPRVLIVAIVGTIVRLPFTAPHNARQN